MPLTHAPGHAQVDFGEALRETWQRRAEAFGFGTRTLDAEAVSRTGGRDREASRDNDAWGAPARDGGMDAAAVGKPTRDRGRQRPRAWRPTPCRGPWRLSSEREAMLAHTDLLAWNPGAVETGEMEREVTALEKTRTRRACRAWKGRSLPTAPSTRRSATVPSTPLRFPGRAGSKSYPMRSSRNSTRWKRRDRTSMSQPIS